MKLALALVVAGCAHQAPASLSPGLAPYAFYVGTWKCAGTQYDEHGAATTHDDLLVRVDPDIANWLHVAVSAKGQTLTSELIGWDPTTKTFHHLWTSNDGASGSLTATAGWQGGSIVFDEDHPDASAKGRMTTTRVDADHYEHVLENDTGGGYRRDYVKQCVRVPRA